MSNHTTPVLYCSLLIPKVGRFAKEGNQDSTYHGFGIAPEGSTIDYTDKYALEMEEDEAETHLEELIVDAHTSRNGAAATA